MDRWHSNSGTVRLPFPCPHHKFLSLISEAAPPIPYWVLIDPYNPGGGLQQPTRGTSAEWGREDGQFHNCAQFWLLRGDHKHVARIQVPSVRSDRMANSIVVPPANQDRGSHRLMRELPRNVPRWPRVFPHTIQSWFRQTGRVYLYVS